MQFILIDKNKDQHKVDKQFAIFHSELLKNIAQGKTILLDNTDTQVQMSPLSGLAINVLVRFINQMKDSQITQLEQPLGFKKFQQVVTQKQLNFCSSLSDQELVQGFNGAQFFLMNKMERLLAAFIASKIIGMNTNDLQKYGVSKQSITKANTQQIKKLLLKQ